MTLDSLNPSCSHASAVHPPSPAVLLLWTTDAWGGPGLATGTDFFSHSDIMKSVGIKAKRKDLIFVVAFNEYCVQCCHVMKMAWAQKPKKNEEVSDKSIW